MTSPIYRKIAKGPHRNSLWLGPDHLLWLISEGIFMQWSEKYVRFYYRDIEALVITRSSHWRNTCATLGIISLLSFAAGSIYWEDGAPGFFWTCVGVFFLFWAILKLAFGASVTLHIQTSVSTTATALLRRSRAQRVLDELSTLIRTQQTDLPPLPSPLSPPAHTPLKSHIPE